MKLAWRKGARPGGHFHVAAIAGARIVGSRRTQLTTVAVEGAWAAVRGPVLAVKQGLGIASSPRMTTDAARARDGIGGRHARQQSVEAHVDLTIGMPPGKQV